MNLKDFLSSRDKPPELYWTLVVEEGFIQAGVWYIGEKAAEVVSISPPAAWETDDELVGATDAALSSAIQKLPENYKEPEKTVFGVSESWVKAGEINEEHLSKIKKLCTELSLTPVGFVVLPEAIAHYYKSQEQAPVSAIVVGLGAEELEVSVFKLGTLIGTTTVARSVSLIEDITEGLSRFDGASPLPSRIIIFDGKGGELEEAKETLLQAQWVEGEKVKFLHTPKVEILPPDEKVFAVSLAGANEIGQVSEVDSQIEKGDDEVVGEVQNVAPIEESVSAESMGFAVGEDISAGGKGLTTSQPISSPVIPAAPKAGLGIGQKVNGYIQNTKNFFHNFSGKFFQKSVVPGARRSTRSLPVLAGVGLAVLIVLGLLWWFIPKAKVTIYVTPKTFQQDANVTFSTSGQFDPSNSIVPAQTVSVTVTGDKTKGTSGTKLIGDKSKGSVQIANGNSASISLAAGTILTSSGGLKFVMDSSASVSGQLLPGSPGTATVNVTAGDIGAQYNLAKGEVFSVGNYQKSLVAGTSQADFSGGSSQQIAAVSKDDQTSLESDLKAELITNAKNQLLGKVSDSQILVNDLAATDIASENFDHKIGDQADTLKLSLTLNVTGIAADRSKLLQFAEGALQNQIPTGFLLTNDQISFNFTFVDQKDTNYAYKATLVADFLPKVNTNSLVAQITGKTPTVAEQYLDSIPGFSRVLITQNPHLPGFLGTLPRVSKNITIEIAAEK